MTEPALTNVQVSDLKMHIERVADCQNKSWIADQQTTRAVADLHEFIHSLQHPPKEV
jgi:16S rRNA G527 N7-methylase RsmG